MISPPNYHGLGAGRRNAFKTKHTKTLKLNDLSSKLSWAGVCPRRNAFKTKHTILSNSMIFLSWIWGYPPKLIQGWTYKNSRTQWSLLQTIFGWGLPAETHSRLNLQKLNAQWSHKQTNYHGAPPNRATRRHTLKTKHTSSIRIP